MNIIEVVWTIYLQYEHFDIFYAGFTMIYLTIGLGFCIDGLVISMRGILQVGHFLNEHVLHTSSSFLQQYIFVWE